MLDPWPLRLFPKRKSIILHSGSVAVQYSIWFHNRKWPRSRKCTNYYTKSIIIKIKPSIEALPPKESILWRPPNFVFEVQLTLLFRISIGFNERLISTTHNEKKEIFSILNINNPTVERVAFSISSFIVLLLLNIESTRNKIIETGCLARANDKIEGATKHASPKSVLTHRLEQRAPPTNTKRNLKEHRA